MKLSDFEVLSFDCYGTLIDWESGIVNALAPLVSRLGKAPDRDTVLQAHAHHESSQQAQTPQYKYSDLLAIVYRRLAEQWGISVPWSECEQYGQSVEQWPAFDDSKEALTYLKQHYQLVILSNVDNRSFAASNEKLGVEFDAVYTAQDVGSYKPADINFEYMLRNLKTLGVEKANILHTAESMFHDHVPATRHGLSKAWIYRRHAQPGFGATMNPGDLPAVDFQFNSMAELANAHRAEQASGQ